MQNLKRSSCILLLIISAFILFGCEDKNTDAYKFKEEYESLNNTKSTSGKTIRELKIDKNNPFVYKTADEIVELINKKETFIVYFGFASCPWCRSVLPTLIESLKDNSINTVYYVDIENIRDKYEIENNKPKLVQEGSEGYNKLLELLGDKLSDYTIENVKVGEKRIYAPNIVSVIYGKVISVETGISSLHTDGYMELTEKMINETYDKFDSLIKPVSEVLNSCNINTGC